MNFPQPLIEAVFLKRYKRFLADVTLDSEEIQVHVPNTGSLKSVIFENSKCWISKSSNKNRKLPYTLEAIQTPSGWAGTNTGWPNKLAMEAWKEKLIPHWKSAFAFSECKINNKSRIDLVLTESPNKPSIEDILLAQEKYHFVEVKNVSWLSDENEALFPDAVTTRGLKHIEELMSLRKLGHSVEMLYIIQREGVKKFKTAADLDLKYAQALKAAVQEGLIITAYQSEISLESIQLKTPIFVEI